MTFDIYSVARRLFLALLFLLAWHIAPAARATTYTATNTALTWTNDGLVWSPSTTNTIWDATNGAVNTATFTNTAGSTVTMAVGGVVNVNNLTESGSANATITLGSSIGQGTIVFAGSNEQINGTFSGQFTFNSSITISNALSLNLQNSGTVATFNASNNFTGGTLTTTFQSQGYGGIKVNGTNNGGTYNFGGGLSTGGYIAVNQGGLITNATAINLTGYGFSTATTTGAVQYLNTNVVTVGDNTRVFGSSTLNFSNGGLFYYSASASTNAIGNVSGLTFGSNNTAVLQTIAGTAGTNILNIGSLAMGANATLQASIASGNSVLGRVNLTNTTGVSLVNGILAWGIESTTGNFLTYTNAGVGTNFLGGYSSVTGGASGTYQTNTTSGSWGANSNISLTTGTITATNSTTINSLSLKSAAATTLNLGGFTLTNNSGGILTTGNNVTTITNGTIIAGSGNNYTFYLWNTGNQTQIIGATIANNGANAVSVIKAGANSTVLAASNTYTGQTLVEGGTLTLTNNGSLAGSSGTVDVGSTLNVYTTNPGIISTNLTVNGTLAILNTNGALTISGINGTSSTGVINSTSTYSGTNSVITSGSGGDLLSFTPGGTFLTLTKGAASFVTLQGTGTTTLANFNSSANTATNSQTVFSGGTWNVGSIGQNSSGSDFGTNIITNGATVISSSMRFMIDSWNVGQGTLVLNADRIDQSNPHNLTTNLPGVQINVGSSGAFLATNIQFGLNFGNTGTAANVGTITINGYNGITVNGGTFQLSSGSSPNLILGAESTAASNNTMSETNLLAVSNGGTANIAGSITLATAGATINGGSVLNQTNEVILSGTNSSLTVAGTISANTNVAGSVNMLLWNGGTLSFGTLIATNTTAWTGSGSAVTNGTLFNSNGILAVGNITNGFSGSSIITGNYSESGTGIMSFKINGTNQAANWVGGTANYSFLSVSGTATNLSGQVTVAASSSASAIGSTTLTLVTAVGGLSTNGLVLSGANVVNNEAFSSDGFTYYTLTTNATSLLAVSANNQWTNADSTGTWGANNSNNWTAGIGPNATNQFGSSAFFSTAGGGGIVTLTTNQSSYILAFNNGTNGYNIAGNGSSTLTLDGTMQGTNALIKNFAGSQTITVPLALNSTLEITNILSTNKVTILSSIFGGTNGLQLDSGTLVLGGSNSYTGGTVILGGTLVLSNAYALGTTAGTPLNISSGTFSNNYNLTYGAVTFGNSTLTGSGTLIATSFTGTNTVAAVITQAISGAAPFNQTGAGTTTLSGSNSYSGVTTITNGSVEFLNENSLYGGSNSLWTASNIVVQSSGRALFSVGTNTGSFTTNDITTLLGNLNLNSSSNGLEAGSYFGIDTTGTNFTLTNTIGNAIGLNKVGSGTLTITASNSYSGGTIINGGQVTILNTNALGSTTGSLNVISGSLNLGNFSIGVGSLTLGNGTITGTGSVNTLSASSFTLTPSSGTISGISNNLAGAGATLTQSGGGTTILSGSNSYSGGTIISVGTLLANNSNALAGGAVTLNGGTLNLTNINETVTTVSLGNATIAGTGILTGSSFTAVNNGTATVSESLAGVGAAFTQNGVGTTTLSTNNGYTGGTIVNNGTLIANNTNALAGGNVTVNGGTLNLTNINETVTTVSLGNGTISGTGTMNGTGFTATNNGAATISESLAGAGAGFTQSGAGTTTLSASNSFTGTTTISAGSLALGSAGTLASTNVNLGTAASKGTWDLTAKAGYTMTAAQTLSGYGTVTNGVGKTLTINGGLSPGNTNSSITGIVTVAGNLTLGTSSTTTLQLYGTTSGTGYDQVSVTGTNLYGGSLNIFLNTNSFVPTVGETFTLYNASTIGTNDFNQIALAGSWTGAFVETNTGIWNYFDTTHSLNWTFNDANGQLAITAVPEPADLVTFGGILSAAVLIYRRRKARME